MVKYCQVKECRFNYSHTTSGHKCGRCGKYGHGVLECVQNDNEVLRIMNQNHGGDMLSKDLRCTVPNCSTFWNHTIDAHNCQKCDKKSKVECCSNEIKLDCPVCRQENIINANHIGITGVEQTCVVCLDNKANVFFEKCKHINTCINCCESLNKNKTYRKNSFQDKITSEDESNFDIDFDNIREELKENNNSIFINVYVGMGCTMYIRRNNMNEEFKLFFMHSDNWGQYGIQTDYRPYLKLFTEDYQEIKLKN